MIGGVCVIYGSQTGGGKKVGRGEKDLLVVAEIGSRGKEEGKKRDVGGCLIGKSREW